MPQAISASAFDYSNLDPETSQFVQQQTGEIRMLMRRTAQDIFEIGQKLIEIKARLRHGRFLEWLEAEFDWSERAAQQFMNVAKTFKNANFADLQLAPSALYVLAAPSTPEAAKEEAIARASAGEPITHKAAKELKQKYSSPPAKPKGELTTQPQPEPEIQTKTPFVQTKLRQRATEPTSQKPEILAIRPKKALEEPGAPLFETGTRKPLPPTTPKLVETGSWWQLGEQHLLYCGNPTSPRFQERLPNQVALSLAFSPSRSDWPDSLLDKIKSALCLFTIYQDQDLILLRELVERSLLLYTESSEAVVFSFLPDSELLLLAHKLGCRCFVAEPDVGRCDEAIATWKQAGGKVEKVSGIRF